MKLCILSLALTTAAAVKCGTSITKDCVADEDIRYDNHVGYDLKDHGLMWKRMEGLYRGPSANYMGNPATIVTGQDGYPTFLNVTIDGSRVHYNRYSLNGGVLQLSSAFYTSTFEKDGSASALGFNSNYDFFEVGPFQVSTTELTAVTLENGRTLYGSGSLPNDSENYVQETYVCLAADDEGPCDGLSAQLEYYLVMNGMPNFALSVRTELVRMEKDDWVRELDATIAQSDLAGQVDLDAGCATNNCPTEEQWRTKDPYYNASPYQEPDGSLKGGFVAGIVVAGAILLVATLYFAHKYLMTKQEKRLKNAFASSIAASMSHRCSARNLSPDELRKEFDGIDADHNGTVSKGEFKNFITSTDVATLDPHDFEVLFSSIDIDGNKEIDFSEFCAFFALIRQDVEKAMRHEAAETSP
mmetsp:Transcript_9326/g.17798  ORF Transcript_9326/g.17798 Transcript_9326/m.17798 type:complete len:414 (-) Transcript_9326:180-1421(-)|eukprot:scaffold1351_cov176-Amphora_coffeaeformis.AAC.18